MDEFAELFFDVQQAATDFRQAAEKHIRELRRLVQIYDHLAPHEMDGEGWAEYVRAQCVRHAQ